MVTYQEFTQVALDQCGNDQETFSKIASDWSENKETYRELSKSELEARYRCP